jgi:hypothetical protein
VRAWRPIVSFGKDSPLPTKTEVVLPPIILHVVVFCFNLTYPKLIKNITTSTIPAKGHVCPSSYKSLSRTTCLGPTLSRSEYSSI